VISVAHRPRPASLRGAVVQPTPAARHGHRGLARVVPAALAITSLGALLLAVDPRVVTAAVRHFELRVVIPVLVLTVAFYLLQGLRWHLLLRDVGAAGRLADSQLINLAGQAVTAVLPLGDLTRALLASEASGVEFGVTAATVTVQELTFTLLLVLAAAPGLAHLPHGLAWVAAVVGGVAAVFAILTVSRLFAAVRRLVAATPGVRTLLGQIDALQGGVRQLLARPDVLAGAVFDLGRVVAATASLLLILRGLGVESLGWSQTALVLAVSFVGGALSFLPGGIGANEASVVAILVVLGVNPASAAAAAILQRLTLSGVATVGGLAAFLAVRRRATLSGVGGLQQLIASVRRAAQA
jgi:glycosyltransferase 2 family protein